MNRSITQTIARDNENLSLVIFYYGLCTLEEFFVYRVLTDLGNRFLGIRYEVRCAVYQYHLTILTRTISQSDRNKWSAFPDSARVPSELKQIKDAEGPFNSPDWLFWYSRSIFPFWEKEILPCYFSKQSWHSKWIEVEELKRKGEYLLGSEIGTETVTCWGLLEITTIKLL